jgi:hypothetical protein
LVQPSEKGRTAYFVAAELAVAVAVELLEALGEWPPPF